MCEVKCLLVGQSLTQPPGGAPVAVSGAAAGGTVMQSGLPAGTPLTPGQSVPIALTLSHLFTAFVIYII